MFGFSKLHIKPAAGGLNKFQFNPAHLTTSDFGQLNIVYSRMLYPRDKITIDMGTFMRTEVPLLKPTFGKVSVKNAAIAVPIKRLMMNAEGFFGNKPLSDGQTSHTRYVSWYDLTYYFYTQYCVEVEEITEHNYNFAYYDPERGNNIAIRFKDNKSRWMYKILRTLGYDFPSYFTTDTSSAAGQRLVNTRINALPLLAYLTAYLDCFYARTKVNSSPLSQYLYQIRVMNSYVGGSISAEGLLYELYNVELFYSNSYITSAWESPIAPLADTEPLSSIDTNIDNHAFNFDGAVRNSYFDDITGVSRLESDGSYVNSRAVDYVARVTRWFKRNMLSGSRAYEAIKSQFGINIESAKHDYSTIIDVNSVPLHIGDVTQMSSSTEDSYLGDYAGKAIVDDKRPSHFHYEAKEHCIIIVFSWFSIEPFNWQGMKRDVFRVKPLDFYQPEFDGLDTQPVLRAEVATAISSNKVTNDLTVFGFVNRHDDLRFDNDMITGDFSLNTVDKNLRECWHFGRRDMDIIALADHKAQSDAVLKVDGASYDNIFADMNTDADHFNCQYLFNITLLSTMQSFNEIAQLGVGDLTIERNGNQLS